MEIHIEHLHINQINNGDKQIHETKMDSDIFEKITFLIEEILILKNELDKLNKESR